MVGRPEGDTTNANMDELCTLRTRVSMVSVCQNHPDHDATERLRFFKRSVVWR